MSSSVAVSGGYRAAQVDLAGLLVDASAGPPDRARAVSLYEKAWRDGVPIAAFELGQLYERRVRRRVTAPDARQPDLSKAWSWYQRAPISASPTRSHGSGSATMHPPSPRARRRSETRSCSRRSASYAAAAERAQAEDWPDDTWKHWRYRRATLARLLAREGMTSQVADAYVAVRDKGTGRPTWLEESGDSN